MGRLRSGADADQFEFRDSYTGAVHGLIAILPDIERRVRLRHHSRGLPFAMNLLFVEIATNARISKSLK